VTVSPISVSTNFDKSVSGLTSRRSPSQTSQSITPVISSGGSGTKQQLPLHLAALTRSNTTSSLITSEIPKPLTRATTVTVPMGSPNNIPHSPHLPPQSSEGSRSSSNSIGRAARISTGSLSSQSIQQMLPLRLSEGLALKASSLPRGVAPKTVSEQTQPTLGNSNGYQFARNLKPNNHSLHHSKSSTSILMGNDSTSNSNSGYSHLYHPGMTDRMSNYYRVLHSEGNRGQGSVEDAGDGRDDDTSNNSNLPIVHRRSGSSPVPMSTSIPYVQKQNQVRIPYTKYSQNEDEDDSSKILFL